MCYYLNVQFQGQRVKCVISPVPVRLDGISGVITINCYDVCIYFEKCFHSKLISAKLSISSKLAVVFCIFSNRNIFSDINNTILFLAIFQIIRIYLCMLKISRSVSVKSFANTRFTKSRSAVTSLVPYLDFCYPLSCAMYVEFRSVFGRVPHTVMQIKLWPLSFQIFELVSWLLSHQTVCCSNFWKFFSLLECFLMLHKNPILVSLLFHTFLSYFCSAIKYSECLPFDDINICSCCCLPSNDRSTLQSEINFIPGCALLI